LRTGATVVASPESARCLRASGVPEDQLLVVTGGETVRCNPAVTVRVLPALHSCLFAHSESDSALPCLGDLDVAAQERAGAVRGLFAAMDAAPAPAGPALRDMNAKCSAHDGGQLAFLLTTADGSVLVSGSSGYWRGIFNGLRPDVALLALAGRPNVDGEPFQGSSAQFVLEQAQLLRAGRVAFCHHDPLFPGLPGTDIAPAASALRGPGSGAGYFELEYGSAVPLFP
jgi:L-ascorbate metabolism protein UlaG (beta-lactamase superfamily)